TLDARRLWPLRGRGAAGRAAGGGAAPPTRVGTTHLVEAGTDHRGGRAHLLDGATHLVGADTHHRGDRAHLLDGATYLVGADTHHRGDRAHLLDGATSLPPKRASNVDDRDVTSREGSGTSENA